MRNVLFFFLLLAIKCVSATEVLFIPNFSITEELLQYDPKASFHSLQNWQKISYLLHLNNYKIRLGNLDEISSKKKKIEEHCKRLKENDQIYLIMDYHHHFYKKLLPYMTRESIMALIVEPPAVHDKLHTTNYYSKFSKVITWDDVRVNHKNVFKYNYPSLKGMDEHLIPFHEREFCCMFVGNKTSGFRNELYSERKRVIYFFETKHPSEFSLFGEGWDKYQLHVYKGQVQDKQGHLKKFKFSICYENTALIHGYISEKIFDCFSAGVVPIYLGAMNINEYIPANCFIDRRNFSSNDVLYEYLASMTEEEHSKYLENIKNFLASSKAKEFSNDHFVLSIVNAIAGTNYTLEMLQNLP